VILLFAVSRIVRAWPDADRLFSWRYRGVKDHERLETSRLVLRRPLEADASAMFERYASDPDVTRFTGWPRHRSAAETLAFVQSSDAEWNRWPAGPFLIASRVDGRLLGSTGLAFETPDRAMTGYVLAKDSWGLGFATRGTPGDGRRGQADGCRAPVHGRRWSGNLASCWLAGGILVR